MVRVVHRDQILDKLRNGEKLTYVEISTQASFDQAHLGRAIHLTEEQVLDGRVLSEVNPSSEIIVYSDAFSHSFAVEAVMALQQLGFQHLWFYSEGKEDWISHGLPIEATHYPPTEAELHPPSEAPAQKRAA